MRILHAKVQNFGSYKELEFNFDSSGLTLISGPTGAGKSTLCDVIPWILFGVTSKNGSVDEIRNWNTKEPTKGTIYFEDGLEIVRIRGDKVNDLYFVDLGTVNAERGKDLNDTQKKINHLLGMNADLYLSGAYFHEFSQSAQFFTTTAKNRRVITEQIVDMTFAKKIADNVSFYKKELKIESEELERELLINKDRHKRAIKAEEQLKSQIVNWHEKQASKILQAKANYANFEKNKQRAIEKLNASIAYESEQYNRVVNDVRNAKRERNELETKIEDLKKRIEEYDTDKCESCGSPKQNDNRKQMVRNLQSFEGISYTTIADLKHSDMELRRLEISIKLMNDSLIKERAKENTWSTEYDQLMTEQHPFGNASLDNTKDLANRIEELIKYIDVSMIELSDLELLLDVTNQFRGLLIKNTIVNLENYTNKLLTDHFDAEIRVSFSATDADKIDVTVYKDGNQASFTQLSKGQRQLLKLSFGIAIMRMIANHNGISFNAIFLDEFADGLDENMKVKAFYLVNKLSSEYESVFCIDHSETLKSMFTKKYEVSLVNGNSEIGEA